MAVVITKNLEIKSKKYQIMPNVSAIKLNVPNRGSRHVIVCMKIFFPAVGGQTAYLYVAVLHTGGKTYILYIGTSLRDSQAKRRLFKKAA